MAYRAATRTRRRQPQVAAPPRGKFTPSGLWIPAYGDRLWTPGGVKIANVATATAGTGEAGRQCTGNGSSTYLNWAINFTSSFPVLLFGVFVVRQTSTAYQTAIGLGDKDVTSGGVYGGIGQGASATSIQGWLRLVSGGSAPEVTGPTATIGRTYAVARISRGLTDHVMWVNGARYTNNNSTASPNAEVFGHFSINAARRVTTPTFYGLQSVALGGYSRKDPGEQWMQAFSVAPWATVFAPRRIWVPVSAGGGGQTVAIAQATETDTAQPVTAQLLLALAIAQASETDLAQPLTAAQQTAIAQVAETDAAQALSPYAVLQQAIAQAAESDTALALSSGGSVAIAQASETDAAQAIQATQALGIAQAAEADAAQALQAAQALGIAQATEGDSAQALITVQSKAIAQAAEADEAQALTVSMPGTLGQAVESDAARPLTVGLRTALGQAQETNTAQAVVSIVGIGIGLTLEIDVAQAVGAWLLAGVGIAAETDSALAFLVTGAGQHVISPRLYAVPDEDRIYLVPDEN